VFDEWIWICVWELGDEYHAKEKLALIPNMIYLLRVQARTQFKSEAYKPREDTIKGITRKSDGICWFGMSILRKE